VKVSEAIRSAKQALASSGIESARLDAEVLCAHALSTERCALHTRRDDDISTDSARHFEEMVQRRSRGCPVAYIAGVKEFWSIPISVTQDVLIPRPETETVVEEALKIANGIDGARILDLCTGSGCIAAALASELPDARIVASDASERALAVARRNLEFAAGRAELLLGDLLEPAKGQFDIITANPPYIAEGDIEALMRDIRDYEPMEALSAGLAGLDFIERIIEDAPAKLARGGWLVMEVGAGQAAAATSMAVGRESYDTIRTARDLAGIERVVLMRKSPL